VSGVAGGLLHHLAAGPVGVLGIVVPLLLGALGVAMLRVRRLGTVHARISVGILGVLAGVTGIIQVVSGNPSLSQGVAPLEEAGGMLGWVVGYPLAVLFSSVAAVILFVLLIAFSVLVISGRTIADLREQLAERRAVADQEERETGDNLATRVLGAMRRTGGRKDGDDETATRALDSYDGDEPFRSSLETEKRPRGSGHGRLLMSAARAEVHARTSVGRNRHSGGGRGDGAVVVVDGQRQGLQDAGLGEGPLDREQGGAGEVALALGVTADRAGEAVVAQVVQGGVVDHLRGAQEVDLGGREGEGLDGVEKAPRPGHDAVAARGGQFAPEQLEDAAALRGARAQGALQHRQLVLVGEQGR